MKKLLTSFFLLAVTFANAQLLTWTPSFIQETSMPVTITANAAYGNQALLNYNPFDVYVHMGVITNLSTNSSDWKYVRDVWATTYSWEQASVASGKSRWTYTIDSSASLRTYFGITNPNEHIPTNIYSRIGAVYSSRGNFCSYHSECKPCRECYRYIF